MRTNTEIVNNQRLMVMLNINKILNNDRLLRATTGLNLQAFDHLLKEILILSPSSNGKKHDKKIHDQEDIIGGIPEEISVLADLGFQGVQKQYENIHLPHKKPKGGELTPQQKQENKELAKERVVYENAFAGVKRYKAVSDIYRNRVSDFDDKLMLTACGLWNLYLEVA